MTTFSGGVGALKTTPVLGEPAAVQVAGKSTLNAPEGAA
jgi:hypothetical protein